MGFDIEEVIQRATNSEKYALLSGADFWHTAPIERLGVPSIRLSDGPNGIRGTKLFGSVPALCLPCGTALGATWDKELLTRAGELLGKECVAKGAHCWLGPTMNIQRSPLGGRGFESYSEDPYLSGMLGSSAIRGCESIGVQSTPKHLVCNDQEHERRGVNTLVTERALREVYLRPFQIVAREVRPSCLMVAYNKVNGIHVSEDKNLLENIIRDEWSWDPLIVSDWFGTYSTVQAINAGLDLEMPGLTRWRGRLAEFAHGSRLIKQSTLDSRARHVLSFVKKASNLSVASVEGGIDCAEDRSLNREICGNSIVLLKNDNTLLPLPKQNQRIALLGSHMKSPEIYGGGSAALRPYYSVTPWEAINQKLAESNSEIVYGVGAYAHKMLPVISRHLERPDGLGPGMVLRFYNEPPSIQHRECVGVEWSESAYTQLMDYQNDKLTFDLFYITAEAVFTPDEDGIWEFGLSVYGTANAYLDGELLIDETTQPQVAGGSFFGKGTKERICSKFLQANKQYKLSIEFGSSATSKIQQTGTVNFQGGGFSLGAARKIEAEEAIEIACQLAASSDHAVICTGLGPEWESEGFDRTEMTLPPGIDKFISRVLEVQPNTVVVLQCGTPVEMPWIEKASAIVQAWYGGCETGNGIADVLFGDVNPSAKLPLSWPAKKESNPAFLNFGSVGGRVLYGEDVFVGYKFYEETGRQEELLFPFGHGLSYTNFECHPISVSREKVTIEVKNTGSVTGAQVIQLYIHSKTSPTRRPYKELHGFEKVLVQPGATKMVDICIDKYAGSHWDESEQTWLLEAGQYEVLMGTSSATKDLIIAGTFTIEESTTWSGL